jgi:hypothetical protein
MTQNVNVPLSDRAYRRLKRWSEARQQDIGDAIADFLLENLPDNDTLELFLFKKRLNSSQKLE